ncbi:MAG: phosphohydrolase [Sphaerochaetaceae bacterium]
MKSPKEISLEQHLMSMLDPKELSHKIGMALINDAEVQYLQEYANEVSIKRLGYNDHGPVHMRQVAINSLTMLRLLHESGVQTSLEKEDGGTFDDSLSAVLLASFLHDLGMTVSRTDHETTGCIIARPIMQRILDSLILDDLQRKTVIISLATEGILGHMASKRIHSVEAGLILIADGCDMEKGRARIPLILNTEAKVGDIHKYSSKAIECVTIGKGDTHPIKIEVEMSSDVGFFQIEEVLLQKIAMSPDKGFVEVYAWVTGQPKKQYL